MKTRITELLGIERPIIQGGMQNLGVPALAAAVSNAGGCGTLNRTIYPSNEAMREAIRNMARVADNACARTCPELEREPGMTLEKLMPVIGGARGREGYQSGDVDRGLFPVGSDVGLISDVPTVRELLDRIVEEYVAYSAWSYFHPRYVSYHEYVALAIATFTFTEIGLNLRGILLSRRDHTPLLHAIKTINLVASLISLVLTQSAILSFAAGAHDPSVNALLGLVTGGCAAALGVYMIGRTEAAANRKGRRKNA